MSFVSAVIFALGGFLIKAQQEKNSYKLQLENNLSRSLDDFGAAVNNVALTLNKIRFVSGAQQLSQMSAELLTEAETAKAALAQIPANSQLSSLNKFLSQVGGYAMTISKKLIGGESLGEGEAQRLDILKTTAESISQIVTDSRISYNNLEYWATELESRIDNQMKDGVLEAFEGLEGELDNLPTLVYDGPYSDHIYEKKSQMLENAQEVREEDAQEIASKFAECSVEDLRLDGTVEGNVPAFRFVSENVYTAVSKKGGFAVYMRKGRQVKESILSYDQAINKAERYLERVGITNMTTTYYYTNEGVCVISFAYLDGKTICYTDLIKVGVAMDNGEIMLYEAGGYISNHTERAFEAAVYTEEQAAEKVSSSLIIKGSAIALIPTRSGTEARCYEFTCNSRDGQEVLVYINVLTLNEEEVLVLLKSDGGTLVK